MCGLRPQRARAGRDHSQRKQSTTASRMSNSSLRTITPVACVVTTSARGWFGEADQDVQA
jgi:hypothetical protein